MRVMTAMFTFKVLLQVSHI